MNEPLITQYEDTLYSCLERVATILPKSIPLDGLFQSLMIYVDNETGKGLAQDIGYSVGFKNRSHFSQAFKKRFGYAPSEYVKLLS